MMMVALALVGGVAASASDVASVAVFQSGQDGYHTFRIPAIVRAANGALLAFAEGRKTGAGDAGDIDIVVKRSEDDGRSWGPLQMVQDEWADPAAPITIGNPVPIVDTRSRLHSGRIWLAFTRNNDGVFVTHSDDHGRSWSERREITAAAKKPTWSWYATGPGHGIQLARGQHAGRLIVPSDHRDAKHDGWGAHVLYSDDHGETWHIGAVDTRSPSSELHPNENMAAELSDGRVYVNARDQHGLHPATRAAAYSSDGGQSFDAPFAAEPQITTPVVQNSLLRVSKTEGGDVRDLLLLCGPGQQKQRRDLTIRASVDDGRSWARPIVLHAGPAAYSDMVGLDRDRVGILFEGGEKLYDSIHFAVVEVGDLIPPGDASD